LPRAVVLTASAELGIESLPDAKLAPTELLIRPRAVGICGSDIDMYRGVYTGLWKLPVVMGHEFSGEVVAAGAAVRHIRVGDRVTAEEIQWCGRCRPCKAGFPNFCENVEELGFTVPGALAEGVAVDEKYIHMLPASVSFEAGSLVEPASVSYNALFVQGGGVDPGDFVAVFGAGPIGLLSAMLAKSAGAEVCIFEVNEWRRKMAKEAGADHVYDPLEVDATQTVKDLTGGYGANMAVECTANEKVVPLVIDSLRFRGRGVLIGMLEKPSTIQGITFVRRGISLVGSLGHSGHDTFPHVIGLMSRGIIRPEMLITNRFSIWDAESAFRFAVQRGQSMKITLTQ
jgi:threonine dehydrogenase-like Zn-dependent dehydrogenase